MKIICVVKFVPDVDNFSYDYEKHRLIRENSRMMINPDDACAVGFALQLKKTFNNVHIEVLTMAPESVVPLVEDILRVDVDQGTIISDRLYAGSDTYATSLILGRYLSSCEYDCILTGSHAVDGDTAHIPAQLAALLSLNQMSGISGIEMESLNHKSAVIEVEDESAVTSYEVDLPAILSLTRESGYRLPYVRYKNLNMDVRDRLTRLSNTDLGFDESEVGAKGSLTTVVRATTKKFQERSRLVVGIDEPGIETVYDFLKEKGFI